MSCGGSVDEMLCSMRSIDRESMGVNTGRAVGLAGLLLFAFWAWLVSRLSRRAPLSSRSVRPLVPFRLGVLYSSVRLSQARKAQHNFRDE